MSNTTVPRLIGMSGSLRSGSYSNAVLETLREQFAGRADLRIYDLRPIPLMAYKPVAIMATSRGALGGARCLEHMRVALESMLSRVALAREVTITSSADKVRDGRLVDEPSLGFACGAIEALLHEIRLWRMAESLTK